jgi:hypothetical protein
MALHLFPQANLNATAAFSQEARMFGRNRGATGVASEALDRATPYVARLANDEKLRRELVTAVSAGVAARRRASRQAGLLGAAARLWFRPCPGSL